MRQLAAFVAVHLGPPFWRKEGHGGSAMVPFERAMAVSYTLSIVTVNYKKKQNGIFNPFKFTVTSAILVTHRR